jgi:hypothetical protein
MTREELIPLIQEAVIVHPNANPFDFRLCELATIEHFAKLVAEAEREACADILLEYAGRDDLSYSDESLLKHLFDLIRARGKA